MKEMVGYWVIGEALIIFITALIGGMELDAKAIVGEIIFVSIFFTLLFVGSWLMV